MKNKILILLSLVCLTISCSPDPSNNASIPQKNDTTSAYERITQTYKQEAKNTPKRSKLDFWSWLKRIAMADAKAAAAYAAKHGLKSDWKEALLVGASASVVEALTPEKPKKGALAPPDTRPYQAIVLSSIEQIKTAQFDQNTKDDLGYKHYVLVNEVLKDPTLSTIPKSDLIGIIYDKIYAKAETLGIQASYEKEKAVAFLQNVIPIIEEGMTASDTQMYAFEQLKDQRDFESISTSYTTIFSQLNDSKTFTAFSKEMETAVLQDASLSQTVKDVLLLEIATYRFGYTYYSVTF